MSNALNIQTKAPYTLTDAKSDEDRLNFYYSFRYSHYNGDFDLLDV